MFHKEPMIEKREKVTVSLSRVISNTRPLNCDKSDAQKVLDALQTLLDTKKFQDRKTLIAAICILSQRTELYPIQLFIKEPPKTLGDEAVTVGGFAKVYKVLFQGHDMCFKAITLYTRPHPDHVAKVHTKEVILWSQLLHLNILPLYGLARIGSRSVYISPWAANGNLVDYLVCNPHVDRLLLCADTAAGMEYLHQNDIVHGDLKGYNIVVDSSGRAVLCDFGLSGVTDFQTFGPEIQSAMASEGGTRGWQAPELLLDQEDPSQENNTKESDVFAWGSVCYEIFTGRLPYHSILKKPALLVLSILRGKTPTRPEDGNAAWHEHGLTQQVWGLMEDCWAVQADKRPKASAVVARLNENVGPDTREPGEWIGTPVTRFRMGEGVGDVGDVKFWEDLDLMLARLVSGLQTGSTT